LPRQSRAHATQSDDGTNRGTFNHIVYNPPKVPSILTTMTMGTEVTNPSIYGDPGNHIVLDYNKTVDIIFWNTDGGMHPCESSSDADFCSSEQSICTGTSSKSSAEVTASISMIPCSIRPWSSHVPTQCVVTLFKCQERGIQWLDSVRTTLG
jgi:hypothetical protein